MRRALPGVLFGLLVVAVYADPLLTRRVFSGRDLIVYNHPMDKAIHDAYARGRLPVWMSEVSGGRPLLPNPNAGALYPVRAILSVTSFPAATRLFPVLHWIVAGLGMVALLRLLNGSPSGSWIGAVTYVFSGVGVGLVFFPNLQPGMAWLPWVVWGAARPGRTTGRKVILLASILALDMLAGDVFTIGMALLAAALWALIEARRPERIGELMRLAAAAGLAALATAPLWLAALLWVPETVRAVSGMKLGEVLGFSVSPLRLLELVVPFPFGATWAIDATSVWGDPAFQGRPTGFFATLYAGAFALVACFAGWRSRVPGARLARALLLLGIAFAVPASLLPAAWSNVASPLPLRNPEKFAVLIAFALALAAGLEWDRLCGAGRRPRWLLAAGGALAAAALAAVLFPSALGRFAVRALGGSPGLAVAAQEQLGSGLAEGAVLWMATLVAIELLTQGGRSRVAGALVLLTLVPIVANRRAARTFREEAVMGPTAFARQVAAADPRRSFRVLGASLLHGPSPAGREETRSDVAYLELSRRTWSEYTHALWSEGTVFNRDCDRGDFSRLDSLRRLVLETRRLPNPDRLFSSLSLRWVIRFRDEPPVPGYVRTGGDGLQEWSESAQAAPDIRVVERWKEASSAPQALALLGGLSQGEIVVETGERRAGASSGGTVRVLERSPERLRLETECSEPGWLFVLRGYWPYRRVLVDEVEVEAVPAQLAFSAVPVPAGRHRLDWKERLPGLEASRWGPVLFFLAAALLWAGGKR